MSSTLILRMPPAGTDETEWLVVDGEGMRAGPRQRGPLSLAAAVAQNRRLVVLVSATDVMLAEPELPPGSGAKLARAVPFALEEQLTEDIDNLHFAVGRRGAGTTTPAAVVSSELLRGWIAALNAAGLNPGAMYVDVSLLPENPGQTILWIEDSRLSVRRAGQPPFTVEVSPIEEALAIAGVISDPHPPADHEPAAAEGHAGPKPRTPESALLFATQEDWAKVQDSFDKLVERFASLKVQLLPEGPLVWLARELPGTHAINLLQGEFAPPENYGSQWRRWRVAAFLGLGLLGTHIAAEALSLHQAKKQSAELQSNIDQIFASTLPGERPVDARRQMQARLSQIRGSAAGPEYFLRTLQSLSDAIAARPHTSIDALSYRESTLDLKITAPSVDDLAQLSQAMQSHGSIAEIQSSTPAGTGIEGRVQIRAAADGGRK
jgi:general secretion pathway protein L